MIKIIFFFLLYYFFKAIIYPLVFISIYIAFLFFLIHFNFFPILWLVLLISIIRLLRFFVVYCCILFQLFCHSFFFCCTPFIKIFLFCLKVLIDSFKCALDAFFFSVREFLNKKTIIHFIIVLINFFELLIQAYCGLYLLSYISYIYHVYDEFYSQFNFFRIDKKFRNFFRADTEMATVVLVLIPFFLIVVANYCFRDSNRNSYYENLLRQFFFLCFTGYLVVISVFFFFFLFPKSQVVILAFKFIIEEETGLSVGDILKFWVKSYKEFLSLRFDEEHRKKLGRAEQFMISMLTEYLVLSLIWSTLLLLDYICIYIDVFF